MGFRCLAAIVEGFGAYMTLLGPCSRDIEALGSGVAVQASWAHRGAVLVWFGGLRVRV